MRLNNDWLIWQLADSAFPTGGFAHSGGLEAAWQHGAVSTTTELAGFIETSLNQIGHGTLPFVTTAYRAPQRLAELDRLCDAFISNQVANRASRLQGLAFLTAAERSFPSRSLANFRARSHDERLPIHLGPIFGVVTRWLELDRTTVIRLFLFLHLRGLLASALRLGITGPFEAQSLQCRLAAHAESVITRCQKFSVEDIAQTSPILDIFQATHDRLYSRLFQS